MTAIRGAAAITGAASGIGRALAIELAQRGCDLALADRDEAGLKTLAAELGAQRKISVHRVDVSEPDDIDAMRSPRIPRLASLSTMPAWRCSGTYSAPLQRKLERMAKGT